MFFLDKDPTRAGDEFSAGVIGALIEVHRSLGPGLLESTYEACVAHELGARGIPYETQRLMPVVYKGVQIDCGYRIDMLVDGKMILEIKSTSRLLPIHKAQLITYLRLADVDTGLLVNFNVPVLRHGIRRLTRSHMHRQAPR